MSTFRHQPGQVWTRWCVILPPSDARGSRRGRDEPLVAERAGHSHGFEGARHSPGRIRMAQEQIPAWDDAVGDASNARFRLFGTEVHEDVATEHHVCLRQDGGGIGAGEIVVGYTHVASNEWSDLIAARPGRHIPPLAP